MENHSYSEVANAPYLSSFASRGTLFTNYHANTHPSLPNYMAMTSGKLLCNGSDSCPRDSFANNNIFRQATYYGVSWKAWEESMPSNCDPQDSGQYAVRHNPPPYYTDINPSPCSTNDVPLPSSPSLARFNFVTPDVCSDMHSCSVSTGDTWLSKHVPAYLADGAIVIITFDEDDHSSGNHVYTAEVGPGVPVKHDAGSYTHYNLLGGLEKYFGFGTLGNAVGKTPLPV